MDDLTVRLGLHTLATFDLRPMVLTEFVRDVVSVYLDSDNAYVFIVLCVSVFVVLMVCLSVYACLFVCM